MLYFVRRCQGFLYYFFLCSYGFCLNFFWRSHGFGLRVLKHTKLAKGLSLFLWLDHWFNNLLVSLLFNYLLWFNRLFLHNLMSFSFELLLLLDFIYKTSCNNYFLYLWILKWYMLTDLRFMLIFNFINSRFWIFININQRFLNNRYWWFSSLFLALIHLYLVNFHRWRINVLKLDYVIFFGRFYNIFSLF